MAISKIVNKVYKLSVPFWAFRLDIRFESVRTEKHVGVHAQVYLFQNVFESTQIRENPFGKCTLILHFPAILTNFFSQAFCHWLFPKT